MLRVGQADRKSWPGDQEGKPGGRFRREKVRQEGRVVTYLEVVASGPLGPSTALWPWLRAGVPVFRPLPPGPPERVPMPTLLLTSWALAPAGTSGPWAGASIRVTEKRPLPLLSRGGR